ncbi:hypothetical protein PIB30_083123 [Stylosanthes scabra]|uniref:Uncharacterized protein n=1 Tax=Stylosanthes scabra TaxID=79078 RepID=A0ABU6TUF0_9FABA|nr:hypothetical protein [Stylosanthes scabra]
MVNESVSKKGKAPKHAKTHTKKKSKQKKDVSKAFDERVTPEELNEEDYAVHKFFQGKTQAALSKLIMDTPLDTDENKRLFMRAFVLYIKKCFLLATSSANVTPRALPTLFDVENTRRRNYALHVYNFSLRR